MQNIYGNIQGIKASQIKRLQELYEQRQPGDRFITPEFAQALARMSTDIHHPICCYINRRGQVIRIAVGTPNQTQIPPILLTDTVGFIHELPPQLMDAFRATLEEVVEADAMLHVVDLSHPAWESHIASVEEILQQMPEIPEKSLIVFNKIDHVNKETLTEAQQRYPEAVFISATHHLGLETLKMRSLKLIDEPIQAMPAALRFAQNATPQNSY